MDQRDYRRKVAVDVRIEKGTRLAGVKDPRVSPLRTTLMQNGFGPCHGSIEHAVQVVEVTPR